MKGKLGKTGWMAAAAALAATASSMLGGIAFADGGWGATPAGGNGGTATNNCLNVGIPILSGINVIAGQGTAIAASCTANANGS